MKIERYSLKLRSLGMMLLFSVTFVQAATKTSIGTGNWNTAAIWNSGVPTASDNAIVNTSVTIDNLTTVEVNDLDINTATGKLVVAGTLIVNGNLTMDFSGNNQSELELSPGCRVIVNGNVSLGNKVSLALSSYLVVRGNFTKQGSATQGAISISGAHIYILGTVSTPWSNFGTSGSSYSGTTGSISDLSDFGTSADLARNLDIIPTEILASFNCNSSTTPSWNTPNEAPHTGASVATGGTISLSANAKSSDSWAYQPVTYHWKGPNGFSQTTTNTSLDIGNASPAMSGDYVCTAMNTKGCFITGSAYVVVSDCLPSGYEYYSRDNYTGLWTDPLTWGRNYLGNVIPPPYNPNNTHTIGISGYVTLNADLELSTSTVYICDTLVVTGDFLATNPTITIGSHGVLVVLGDYTATTRGSINVNQGGRIIIAGNYENSPAQGSSVIHNNGGAVYVFDQSPVLGGLVPTGWNTIDLNSADNPLFKFYCTLAGGNCPANPVITSTTSASRCGTGTVTLQAAASPSGSVIKWYDQATGGNLLATGTSYTTPVISSTTSYYVDATNNGITSSPRTTVTATVQQPATATISYAGTPFCKWLTASQNVTLNGTSGGTYTASPSGLSINSGTGAIVPVASVAGTYTVTYTIPATGECGVVTSSTEVTIIGDQVWTGSVSTDWNVSGNWYCGVIPDLTTNVRIPNVPNKPILQNGAVGAAQNIVIESGSSLTVVGNTLQITGTITNSGTFTASAGTIELKGSSAQSIPANTFAGNTVMNLTINNAGGVGLQGPLSITGVVAPQSGNLSSDGNLTLVSTAAQTALVDGSGSGGITGNVIVQRYIPSAFGYKYFSSPFQSATVGAFSPYVNLAASFPTFYSYDESKSSSGWVTYTNTSGSLSPLQGYAANFGTLASEKTVSLTGTVNSNGLSTTLYNTNKTYTKGFNLVGNPYPSPIDWNATSGWTKGNIDNAVYYFNAGTTDQYTGTYSTYINGMSSDGVANNIIAAMQGFFIHVTDGAYPVQATFGLDNRVRVNNLTAVFHKSAYIDTRPAIRLTAKYADGLDAADPVVIYFDNTGTASFNNELDALKLMNTDVKTPNFYAFSADANRLAIRAIPYPSSISEVSLGLKTEQDGWVSVQAIQIENLPSDLHIYLSDKKAGIYTNLLESDTYKFNKAAGQEDDRFKLIFSKSVLSTNPVSNTGFVAYASGGKLVVSFSGSEGGQGQLVVCNMLGQEIFRRQLTGTGIHEFDDRLRDGVYVVSFYSGKSVYSKKVIITN